MPAGALCTASARVQGGGPLTVSHVEESDANLTYTLDSADVPDGVTVLWASTFVVTKDFLRELPPLEFSLARFGGGAAFAHANFNRKFD